jgi:diguanylate cyclase (GGDEF)-like protein
MDKQFGIKFGIKSILILPLCLVMTLVVFLFESYMRELDRDLKHEYERITRELHRATSILTALDYTLNNYTRTRPPLEQVHFQVLDQVCQVRDSHLESSEVQSYSDAYMSMLHFMIVGDVELCKQGSELDRKARIDANFMPIITYVRDLADYILGVHYIDLLGYMIATPGHLLFNVRADTIEKIKHPDWEVYRLLHRNQISLRGPMVLQELDYPKPLIAFMLPVYRKNRFSGMISLDMQVDKLLTDGQRFANAVRLIDTQVNELPPNAYQPYPIVEEGVAFHHTLYYPINWFDEFKRFVQTEKYVLVTILVIYLFFLIVRLHVGTRAEKSYYEHLSFRDPLTGLRNRRGFEMFLNHQLHQPYIAVAVFDIDDFKKINDNYGHDVGDEVLRYVGMQMKANIRATDTVARFGGEEFVLYLTGDDIDRLKQTIHRVKDTICADSTSVVEYGFSISGGVEIIHANHLDDIDTVIKSADEKLYSAKNMGKNRLVF